MRDDEDQIRQYMPVLRRIIILVAVLTAIPVVMWTITAFVRTYVGPPKTPTFQRMAATPPTGSTADKAATPSDSLTPGSTPAAPQPVVEAKAATTDADATLPASGSNPGPTQPATPIDAAPTAASPTPAPTDVAWPNPAPAAPAPGTTATTDVPPSNPPADAAPPQSPAAPTQFAEQQPAATDWPAPPAAPATDALPAGTPIAGPVPLPRKRPKPMILAQSRVPLPMPRPDAAGPPAPEESPSPLDFLKHIFQPASAGATPSADDSGGSAQTSR